MHCKDKTDMQLGHNHPIIAPATANTIQMTSEICTDKCYSKAELVIITIVKRQ
jgi:hypothetical protein